MGDVIEFWPCEAVSEGLKALDKFEETGSRELFGRWLGKYGSKLDEPKVEQEEDKKGREVND